MTYRATPITQRDGSSLANSNCRMASIATGIDYQTLGAETSTGAKMRAAQSDQSGGTDSGDAVQAWRSGYGQTLTVGDGGSWSDVLAALNAGRLVHLDVWHASVGGPCLSGSGAYGHTMAVAPESNGTRWLVADPWCNPPKWVWTEAAKLQAGAEKWGAQVYGQTGGRIDPKIVAKVVRDLMTRYHAGGPEWPVGMTVPGPPGSETGGAKRVLFTYSKAQDGSGSGGDDVRFISAGAYAVDSGYLVNVGEGASWYYLDGTKGGTFSGAASIRALGLPDASGGAFAVVVQTGAPYADKQARDTVVMIKTTNDAYPAPLPEPCPDCPECPDCPDQDDAVADRDAEWQSWVLAGSPSTVVAPAPPGEQPPPPQSTPIDRETLRWLVLAAVVVIVFLVVLATRPGS